MQASAIGSSSCHVGSFSPDGWHQPSCRLPISVVFLKPGRSKLNYHLGHREPGIYRKRFRASATSDWDTRQYEVFDGWKMSHLDEQDVVTFLDPPKELIPLDPSSFNPASYLWKKIGEIPEERRHNLLSLLNRRLRSRAWKVSGGRYADSKLTKSSASALLSGGDYNGALELWDIRTNGAPLPIAWINSCQLAIFCCSNGKVYGRFIGGYNVMGLVGSSHPLYFSVKELNEVMPTEQPCDLAFELGDGLLNLPEHPDEFPKPAKHPWPLNDQVVVYIRHLGPGVMVGQAWQEGIAPDQVPKKLCDEILMVRRTAGVPS